MTHDESSHDQIEVVLDSEELTLVDEEQIDADWPSANWTAETLEQPTQPLPIARE